MKTKTLLLVLGFMLPFFLIQAGTPAQGSKGKYGHEQLVKPSPNAARTALTSARAHNTVVQSAQRNGTPQLSSLSGYILEGFEGATFPPTGWQTANLVGTVFWAQSTVQHHSGAASALMDYDPVVGDNYLIMPKFSVASTDSLVFWMTVHFTGWPPDSTLILVSTTDSATTSFTNTLLTLVEGVDYPTVSGTWYRFAVSLSSFAGQEVYVAIRNYNENGDGIYIDDVALGTPPANEVSSTSIDMNAHLGQVTQNPTATFSNGGSSPQTFDVTMEITGGYTSTKTITSLGASASQQVTFDPWTPASTGVYTVRVYTQLAGDANTSNDTISTDVTVYEAFTDFGWTTKADLPVGLFGMASAANHIGTYPDDSTNIFVTGGADPAFALSAVHSKYAFAGNSWSGAADLPLPRIQLSGMTVNGKIYFIGGYTSGFTPGDNNDIYDIATNTWSTGAPMPVPSGDYAIGVYNDSLIYYIGGYSGSADLNTVQIYDTYTNTWTTGTDKLGTATSGLRGGINGNSIVVVGGYNQTLSGEIDEAALGVIDPANPGNITWSALAPYPGGTVGRFAGGSVYKSVFPLVIFAGGDPDGAGVITLRDVWGYDLSSGSWKIGTAKPTGVSNISNLVSIVANDSLWMVAIGGYDGVVPTGVNEWLNLGSAPAPVGVPHLSGKSTVQISPNPFSNSMTVKGTSAEGEIVIYELSGKEIFRQKATANETKIGTENFMPGFYMFNYVSKDKTENIKLMKF